MRTLFAGLKRRAMGTWQWGLQALLAELAITLAGTLLMVAMATADEVPAIAVFTKGMTRLDGVLTLFRREEDGALFLQIPAAGTTDLL